MDRRDFLKRGAFGLVALRMGSHLPGAPAAVAAPVMAAVPSANYLVASGGLCAPLTPIYNLAPMYPASPVRDALPSFAASRGGVGFRA
jgi:hypothetical protein